MLSRSSKVTHCRAGRLRVRACARGLLLGGLLVSMHARPAGTDLLADSNGTGFMRIFPRQCPEIRVLRALASLILFPVMLPIKSVAYSCRKGGKLMKRALIGGLSAVAMI